MVSGLGDQIRAADTAVMGALLVCDYGTDLEVNDLSFPERFPSPVVLALRTGKDLDLGLAVLEGVEGAGPFERDNQELDIIGVRNDGPLGAV